MERGLAASPEPSDEGREYLYARGFTDALLTLLGAREWCPEGPPPAVFEFPNNKILQRCVGHLAFPMRSPAGTLTGVWFRAWREKEIRLVKVTGRESLPTGFNLPGALSAGWLGGAIWIVEGVFDLAALHWALPPGDSVFAAGRAGMSPSTRRALGRFARGPVIQAFDNDEAGHAVMFGTEKEGKVIPPLGTLLAREGVDARVYPYKGKDPGEVWRLGGARAIREEFGRWH